jgi:hypothetical protein
MINDLLTSVKETIAERLASPLLGSFVVAWALWNYKFLVILFSAASITQTFKLIETISFPDQTSMLFRGAVYPLASALLYVFVYPYPARFVYTFTQKRQREINQAKRQIEEETLLTLEQSREIRAEFVQLERKHQETIDRLNSDISRLNAALDLAQKSSSSKPDISPAEKLYGKIEPSQLALLKQLEEAGGNATEDNLVLESIEPKVKAEFDLGELERRKLVRKEYSQDLHTYTIEFTHEGRRVLLNNGSLGQ